MPQMNAVVEQGMMPSAAPQSQKTFLFFRLVLGVSGKQQYMRMTTSLTHLLMGYKASRNPLA